jgi:hypothetical protein
MVTLKNQLSSKSKTIGFVDISNGFKTQFHAFWQDVSKK